MEHVKGRISKERELILDNLELWIETKTNRRGLVDLWRGGFTLPPGKFVRLEDYYHLHLEDGRQGDIRIVQIDLKSNDPTTVSFFGTDGLN